MLRWARARVQVTANFQQIPTGNQQPTDCRENKATEEKKRQLIQHYLPKRNNIFIPSVCVWIELCLVGYFYSINTILVFLSLWPHLIGSKWIDVKIMEKCKKNKDISSALMKKRQQFDLHIEIRK